MEPTRAGLVAESARRVVAIAIVVSALVGGVIAAGAAAIEGDGISSSSSGGSTGVSTAPVVRTTLVNSVQIGGAIGYDGSYTVAVPSGASAQEVSQARQAVAQDQQALSADQTAASDAVSSANQAISVTQASVATASANLGADQAVQSEACAGSGASSPSCASATQKVGQDQTQLATAQQQLAAAQASATSSQNENQAKVGSDQIKLEGDQATLASLQASAINSGTTFTALPKEGDVIKQDQSVYALNDESVPLLYGSNVAYRAFYVGMSDGSDVGELTADLIALGFGAGLSQSNHYSAATAAAVGRWQDALGLPDTGEILLGAVVFEPGPIRVTSVTASVGGSVGGGGGAGAASAGGNGTGGAEVLTATSTTPIVTVELDVSQQYLVRQGDAVSIVLPNGTSTVGGQIQSVGSVASCPNGSGSGSAAGADTGSATATQSTCSSSGSSSSSSPTVPLTITLDTTSELANLDQAPVNVDITTQKAVNVLAVPVNALLALQDGGFGVDVVSGKASHLVAVTTGLYAENQVQVGGAGIKAGLRVEVPSS
jgi:hypothetical protein